MDHSLLFSRYLIYPWLHPTTIRVFDFIDIDDAFHNPGRDLMIFRGTHPFTMGKLMMFSVSTLELFADPCFPERCLQLSPSPRYIFSDDDG